MEDAVKACSDGLRFSQSEDSLITDLLLNRGWSYFQLADFVEAGNDYNKALKLTPDDEAIYLMLSNI